MTTKEDTPVVMPMNITVGEFLNRHLEVSKERLKKRTWESHDDTVRVHLTPILGHLKLKELSREHVQYLYTTKRAEGLSAGTVRRIHAVLSSALSRAVRWRLVAHNICQDVDPPRPEASEIRPFDQKEARNFLLGAQSERHHALYCLALTSGMRRGEILGLRWGSLDLAQRTLQVRHALVAGRGSPTFDSPKTTKSRRSIALATKAVDALTRHRKRQCEAGFSVKNDALVFTSTKGTPVNTSRLRLTFKAFLKRTGLPNIRFQDLRHTYATLLLSKGRISSVNSWSLVMMLQSFNEEKGLAI